MRALRHFELLLARSLWVRTSKVEAAVFYEGYCTVPMCESKLCDFASLILGKYCTFVCGSLLRGIKLIELYPPK